jgi:ribosomal protein S18 acetylase RimI-like enzyme
MRIEQVNDADTLNRGAHLFDDLPLPGPTSRFLSSADHHLLFAWDDAGQAVGFISGVEMTHPEKGTEMFLYELGVSESARRQGVATGLVRALESVARDAGCYGMWVACESDNVAALATYRRASPFDEAGVSMLTWLF